MTDGSNVRVDASDLERFCVAVLRQAGMSEDDAAAGGRALAEADLRGIHTHGVALLPQYSAKLRAGGLNPRPHIREVSRTAATMVLDADHALGHLAATRAMQAAIDVAQTTGIGAVAVRNASHFGAAACYSMMGLDRGHIGLACSNTEVAMPPLGGARPAVGNNPLSIAVPAGSNPAIVLDMASSQVAGLKIVQAARRGDRIPLGWALDSEGLPTEDAEAALEGMLAPLAGVKGYAIAVILEALTGILSGAGFGLGLPPFAHLQEHELIGSFMLSINVEAFMPAEQFADRVDTFIRQIKSTKLASNAKEIFLPGELEFIRKRERLTAGIPLEWFIWDDVRRLSDDVAVPLPEQVA